LCWEIEKKNESLVDHKIEISFSLSRTLSLRSFLFNCVFLPLLLLFSS
jgi:hypothetical protein